MARSFRHHAILDHLLGRPQRSQRQHLAEAIAFASDGEVEAHSHHTRLEDVDDVFDALRSGRVDGRMVLDIAAPPHQVPHIRSRGLPSLAPRR